MQPLLGRCSRMGRGDGQDRSTCLVLLGLSLAYIVPLCDVAATSYINFHDGLKGGFSDASYREPGSIIWDVWAVGLLRAAGFLLSAIIYDCCCFEERRRTHRASSLQSATGAGLSNGISSSDRQDDDEEHKERREVVAKCLGNATTLLTMLFLCAKCLTRLIDGIADDDSMLWFWLSIAVSGCFALTGRSALWKHIKVMSREARFIRRLSNPLLGQNADWEALLEEDESQQQEEGEASSRDRRRKGNATAKDLLSLVRDDWMLILLGFAFLLLAAVSQTLIPRYTGAIVDAIVDKKTPQEFQNSTILLVLAATACAVFTGLRGGVFTVVGARVNRRIRQMLFTALLNQEIGFFDTTKTGDLTSRLSADTTKVGDQVSLNVNFFLRNLVQAIGTLCFMFYVSWKLSLVAFVSVPVIVVMSKVYGEYIRRLSKATQEKLAEAQCVAEEALSSMSTIRSFAAENEERHLYRGRIDEYYQLCVREAKAYSFYACSTTLLPNLVVALILFYGGQLVLANDLTSGQLVSFLLYLSSLSDSFNNIGNIFSAFTQALGAADKVFELIRRTPAIEPAKPPVAPPTCSGSVELNNVIFRYPARPTRVVLNGMSLKAKPGQVVALVGPSGGGKTSCVALIEHFYEPESGQVLLDGRPVGVYEAHWFHRHVSIVGQEPVLYARSIRRNIIFGLEGTPQEPSLDEVINAAKLANAHDFIIGLPDGYDTEVGERGVCLSGGQKQRIAIARALCRHPSVLLLDEATSALDAESEHLVQRAIDAMIERGGMTVLVIAHRLSTIMNADNILVVQEGRIVEEGKHADLIKKDGGVYQQLVAKQIEGLK